MLNQLISSICMITLYVPPSGNGPVWSTDWMSIAVIAALVLAAVAVIIILTLRAKRNK